MYLKELTITSSSGEEVRTVPFKKGLNIILGEDLTEQASTNNLGKTTLMRAVDFCLGGDCSQFWKDPEFKNNNQDIVDYFLLIEPIFALTVVNDLDRETSAKHIFKRQVYVHTIKKTGHKSLRVKNFLDGNLLSEDEYKSKIKNLLFNSDYEKPSIRQLIPKFVRKEEQQISFILRYLHSTTTDADYEKIHFFLFGFENENLLIQKSVIEQELKREEENLKVLSRTIPESGVEQILLDNRREMERLQVLRDEFKVNEKYEVENSQLASIQKSIYKLEQSISDKDLELSVLKDRYKKINEEKFNFDISSINLLYEEAGLYNASLARKFEETVQFHNKMLENESNYIFKRIEEIKLQQTKSVEKRNAYADQYSLLLGNLADQGSLAEYTRLNDLINKLSLKVGEASALLSKLKETRKNVEIKSIEISKVNSSLSASLDEFKIKISIFNEYFASFSEKVYGQRYLLAYDSGKNGTYKFTVFDNEANAGSGKKQGIVAAFDLAYIAYISDPRIALKFPKFVSHDKIELVDKFNVDELVSLVKQIDGQYIVPLINEKFTLLDVDESSVIIRLSPNDKFFRVERFNKLRSNSKAA